MDTPTIFRIQSPSVLSDQFYPFSGGHHFPMTVSDYIMDIMESYHISREREKKNVYIYIFTTNLLYDINVLSY